MPPHVLGATDGRRIYLNAHQTWAEARVSFMHELIHLERGQHRRGRRRAERRTLAEAARRLITLDDLAEVIAEEPGAAAAAERLGVDLPALDARLSTLNRAERAHLAAIGVLPKERGTMPAVRHAPTILGALVAVSLAVVGCSPSLTPATSASTSADRAAPAAVSSPQSCGLTTGPASDDLIVRWKIGGQPASASRLGDVNEAACKLTLATWQADYPNDSNDCAQIAYARDNPGYNPDATPAKPLRKVIAKIGAGAC